MLAANALEPTAVFLAVVRLAASVLYPQPCWSHQSVQYQGVSAYCRVGSGGAYRKCASAYCCVVILCRVGGQGVVPYRHVPDARCVQYQGTAPTAVLPAAVFAARAEEPTAVLSAVSTLTAGQRSQSPCWSARCVHRQGVEAYAVLAAPRLNSSAFAPMAVVVVDGGTRTERTSVPTATFPVPVVRLLKAKFPARNYRLSEHELIVYIYSNRVSYQCCHLEPPIYLAFSRLII